MKKDNSLSKALHMVILVYLNEMETKLSSTAKAFVLKIIKHNEGQHMKSTWEHWPINIHHLCKEPVLMREEAGSFLAP